MKFAIIALSVIALLTLSTAAFAGEACCNAKEKTKSETPTTQPSTPAR